MQRTLGLLDGKSFDSSWNHTLDLRFLLWTSSVALEFLTGLWTCSKRLGFWNTEERRARRDDRGEARVERIGERGEEIVERREEREERGERRERRERREERGDRRRVTKTGRSLL